MRELYPSRRLEEITVKELDDSDLIAPLGLWLALRQDAMAAKDVEPHAPNRLQIAAAIGQSAEDWPVSSLLVMAISEPHEVRAAIQRDPRYLATAYPAVYEEPIRTSGAEYDVKPELLYSVMRQESAFYSAALSEKGALGLFQFMPRTFDELNRRWKLLDSNGVKNRESFLLRPDLSIALGARWFHEEFLNKNGGDMLRSLMAHNAGGPAVRDWVAEWKSGMRHDDLEYFVEAVSFDETRIFTRNVFTTLVIAEAGGILKGPGSDARQ
jgi:soluble lytic murein transglycosylase-like protein